MRVFIINSDGVSEVGAAVSLSATRRQISEWCNDVNTETHTNWRALLDVLADTVALTGTPTGDEGAPLKAIADLTDDDMGTCLGLAAYSSTLIGWDAGRLLASYIQLNAGAAGWIVTAVMMGVHQTQVSHELIWRVIGTLTTEERKTVVAQLGAILRTVGFTADDIRALRDPGKVATPS